MPASLFLLVVPADHVGLHSSSVSGPHSAQVLQSLAGMAVVLRLSGRLALLVVAALLRWVKRRHEAAEAVETNDDELEDDEEEDTNDEELLLVRGDDASRGGAHEELEDGAGSARGSPSCLGASAWNHGWRRASCAESRAEGSSLRSAATRLTKPCSHSCSARAESRRLATGRCLGRRR